MDDKGKRVHFLVVDQDVQLHQAGLLVAFQIIVKGSIAPGPGLERVKKVINDLIQGQLVFQQRPGPFYIFHAQIPPPPLLTKFHNRTYKLAGNHDLRVDDGFLHVLDLGGVRQIGRIGQFDHLPVGPMDLVNHAGSRGHQIQVVLPLQPLLNNLQMQQAQKAAPKAKTQSHGCLRLIVQGRVVQL